MRYQEIITERSLADVGVRGDKFYLSGKGEHIDFDKLFSTGKLDGIKGISSSKAIWGEFGPNMGRDVFFVMNAQDTLRANKMHRIGYNDAEDLVANNSYKIGRILSIKNVAHDQGDNLVMGCFPKQKEFYSSDPISVQNNAMSIASYLRKGQSPNDRYTEGVVDENSFGDYKEHGLRLNSIADYANLYYQGAKAAGWYGKEYVKFFAPQNRRQWYPAISAQVIKQANVFSDEAEWIVDSPEFTVPKSTFIVLAIPAKYMEKPSDEERAQHIPSWWNNFDEERYTHYQHVLNQFKNGPYKFKVVDAGKTANQLDRTKAKRWA